VTEQSTALAVIAGSLYLLVRQGRILRREFASRAWPRVPGRVVSARIHALIAPGRTTRMLGDVEPIVWVEYEVHGTRYGTSDVRWAGVPAWAAARTLARYPVGRTVSVAYDPAAPNCGVLEPGPTLPRCAEVAIGLGGVSLGLAWLLSAGARV